MEGVSLSTRVGTKSLDVHCTSPEFVVHRTTSCAVGLISDPDSIAPILDLAEYDTIELSMTYAGEAEPSVERAVTAARDGMTRIPVMVDRPGDYALFVRVFNGGAVVAQSSTTVTVLSAEGLEQELIGGGGLAILLGLSLAGVHRRKTKKQ